MNTKMRIAAWAAVGVFCGAHPLVAQPANDPKGANPPVRQEAPNQHLTPEQHAARMAEYQQRGWRQMLTMAGDVNDRDMENIIAFLKEQESARQIDDEKGRKLMAALGQKGLPEHQVAALLQDFRAAAAEQKTHHEAALAALDQKVGYSKKPRLEATLVLLGALGDEMGELGQSFWIWLLMS